VVDALVGGKKVLKPVPVVEMVVLPPAPPSPPPVEPQPKAAVKPPQTTSHRRHKLQTVVNPQPVLEVDPEPIEEEEEEELEELPSPTLEHTSNAKRIRIPPPKTGIKRSLSVPLHQDDGAFEDEPKNYVQPTKEDTR